MLRVFYASLSRDLRFARPAKSWSDRLSIGGRRKRGNVASPNKKTLAVGSSQPLGHLNVSAILT
jgi:hypothetical protein